MERRRSKRLRKEAPTDAAGGAPELSALEALHPDALEAVLLRLGLVEAWRSLRPVSRAMRAAVDRVVAWPALRLKADTVEKLQLAAARFARDQPRQRRRARVQVPRITLAAGAAIELITWIDDDGQRLVCEKSLEAISSLFSACSASSGSGGSVGSISLTLDISSSMKEQFKAQAGVALVSVINETQRFIPAMLEPLSSPEAEGGSRHSLKSVGVQLKWSMFAIQMPNDIVQLLSRFPRLERLEPLQPYVLDNVASAIPALLPALRSAFVRFSDGAALARLASHPALEELSVSTTGRHEGDSRGPASGFDAFAAGPVASRLRKLKITFSSGSEPEFNIADLPSLRRLTSLEALELNVDLCHNEQDEGAAETLESAVLLFSRMDEYLAGMQRLRTLDLGVRFDSKNAKHIQAIARPFPALCERYPVEFNCRLGVGNLTEDEAGVDAALAELLRAAAPVLVELIVGAAVLKGEAATALAACPRLKRVDLLEPGVPDTPWEPVPVAEAVDVLAACPTVEAILGLIVPFSSEREASELVEPLRRLATSRAFDSPSCFFILRPGGRLRGERLEKAVNLAMELVLAAFPRAAVETPEGIYIHPYFLPGGRYRY
eukprot:tig00001017_g6254.t1